MKGLECLSQGDEITIFFKEGYDRPTNGQRFKFLTLGGKKENMKIKGGFYVDGFTIVAEPIDLDGKEVFKDGKVLPQALFPHTIKKIEVKD